VRALTKISSSHCHRHDPVSRSLEMHCSPVTFDSASSLGLHLESIRKRTDRHTPIMRNNNCIPKSPGRCEKQIEEKIDGNDETRKRPLSSLPSMPRANTDRSLIDISNIDYGVYRHKIIEATLKKHYEDVQAPGDVVLNSLHLNSTDSVIGMRLNDHYDHSLFDFVEEYYDTSEMMNSEHVEHLHPLDHFLTRGQGMERPKTTEKETETLLDENIDREQADHLSVRVDSDLPRSLFDADNNGNSPFHSLPRHASFENNPESNPRMPGEELIPKRSRKLSAGKARRCVANDCPRSGDPDARRELSRTTENRPASAGSVSKGSPKGLALSRAATLPERRERRITRSPGANAGGSKKKLGDYPNWELPSSSECCGATKGELDFTSASSSEIASICSERSSKHLQDTVETPCCSHESSISSASHASRPPWLSGNHGTSFNRKYGRTARNSAWNPARTVKPMSACDDRSRKLAISNRTRSKESSSAFADRGDPASHKRGAASFVSRKRERIATPIERCEADPSTTPRQRDRLENVEEVAMQNDDGTGGTLDPSDSRERALKTAISRKRSVSQDASVKCSALPTTLRADVRQNTVKLNRGSGRQRLRSAGSRAFTKGGSLSPKMELSAEALSYVDDTDRSTVPGNEKLTMQANGIDPRAEKRAVVAENDETRVVLSARDQPAKTKRAENDVKSNNINYSLAWLKVPQKIMRNSRARPASAGNLAGSPHDKAVRDPYPAWRNANAETKSGLSGAKLNARSNDAVDRMRRDEDDGSSSLLREENAFQETETRSWDIAANDTEKLTLPRRDSKIGLAMNSALRRYIKMLKHGLLNHSDKDGIALASLSLTDAISVLSEQKTPLSSEEIQELQSILSKVERNPELLYKESLSNMENVA